MTPQATTAMAYLEITALLRYFIIAGIPFLIFYKFFAPRLSKKKIQKREAGKKDFVHEILHSLQTTLVLSAIGFIVLFTPLKQYTLVYDNVADYPMWWFWLSVPLSLVVHDTYFYWMHRTLHHPKLFKLTHLVHHKSTNPSPWSSYSFHFIEAWTEGLVLIVLAFVMPMHPIAIILFVVSGFAINVYGHLGYELMPKWFRHSFLFQFVNTSVYHNVHHSKFKGNYGLYFRVWDRLMKTEHPDYVKEYDRVQAQRFGTAENKQSSRVPLPDTVTNI